MTELLGKDSLDRYLKNNRPGRRGFLFEKFFGCSDQREFPIIYGKIIEGLVGELYNLS